MRAERIIFQADADLDMAIVRGLRRLHPAIDVQSADEAGLRGRSDPEVLALAAQQGRMLMTHDKRTMTGHFRDFLNSEQHSPGVIVIDQSASLRAAIVALFIIWKASEPEEWRDQLIFLP